VIAACQKRTLIPVYGDGSNIPYFLYLHGHCPGIDAVVRSGKSGATYNIGGNNEWANIAICRIICDLMDKRIAIATPHQQLIEFVTDRPGHDWRYAVDSSRISNELNWQPQETFESGIIKTLGWYCR
jgi:dTDP-glucose 4,6-dehydratase